MLLLVRSLSISDYCLLLTFYFQFLCSKDNKSYNMYNVLLTICSFIASYPKGYCAGTKRLYLTVKYMTGIILGLVYGV